MTKYADVTRVKPIPCEIGNQDFTDKFSKRATTVGEIKYYEEEFEEEERHFKVNDSELYIIKRGYQIAF
jgi:hypothetical protein